MCIVQERIHRCHNSRGEVKRLEADWSCGSHSHSWHPAWIQGEVTLGTYRHRSLDHVSQTRRWPPSSWFTSCHPATLSLHFRHVFKAKKNTSTYDNIYVKSLSKKQKQNIHLSHHGQVFLMAAPPSTFTGVVFQTHLGLLNGAVAALLFPVLDTYIMPGEVSKAVKVKTLVQIMV